MYRNAAQQSILAGTWYLEDVEVLLDAGEHMNPTRTSYKYFRGNISAVDKQDSYIECLPA